MYYSDHVRRTGGGRSVLRLLMVVGILVFLTKIWPPEYVAADEIERHETVFFEANQIGTIVGNPFTHLDVLVNGVHQAMIEPLFMLNYETGAIEPWLGLSMTANETLDEWTLSLRQGVTWSDGEAFTADDMVFTVKMLIEHAPDLAQSANLKRWVEEVKKSMI